MPNMQGNPLIAITPLFFTYGSCQQKPIKSFGTVCLMCDESKVVYAVEPCRHLFCSGKPNFTTHPLNLCMYNVHVHVDCSRRMKTCFECKVQVTVQCPSDSGMYEMYVQYIYIVHE